MLNEQRTNETAGFRGKEDSRLEELSTGTHSALDSMGKLLLEQTLGSRLHYCFSTLIAEVLSLGLISKTCIIYIKKISRVLKAFLFSPPENFSCNHILDFPK